MPSDNEALLDQALTGPSRDARRAAFVALVASEDWRLVLAPHVISQQGYELRDGYYPDATTFSLAAPAVAASEEKIQRALELLGSRFSEDLVAALARHMGQSLVEHALAHLRTAKGERAILLQNVLNLADRNWVQLPEAKRVIRQRLRLADRSRPQLMEWLATAGNLADFADEIREYPPRFAEEWNALGRANLRDDKLTDQGLAVLGATPEPLAYLLRLDPLPEVVTTRMLAAARPDWLVHSMEVAIFVGLHHRQLVTLAELGVRLGGRPMAAATAWVNSARLGKDLLQLLAGLIHRDGDHVRLSDMLWVQRRAPSANRALEDGRKGVAPDPSDAAALVRQLRGEKILELVREILGKPREQMMETVLRPMCAVSPEAATEVVALCRNADHDLSRRAREVRQQWRDVLWPEEPPEEEIPRPMR
jgi:hypothetical protein